MHHLNSASGTALDGPGSLLNYQGHPVTAPYVGPSRDQPQRDANHVVPRSWVNKTESRSAKPAGIDVGGQRRGSVLVRDGGSAGRVRRWGVSGGCWVSRSSPT